MYKGEQVYVNKEEVIREFGWEFLMIHWERRIVSANITRIPKLSSKNCVLEVSEISENSGKGKPNSPIDAL